MSGPGGLPLSEQSFTAATPDESVFVRVAVPGHGIADRIVACADVAYLQGQLAVRAEWERAQLAGDALAGMPTAAELATARDRLAKL